MGKFLVVPTLERPGVSVETNCRWGVVGGCGRSARAMSCGGVGCRVTVASEGEEIPRLWSCDVMGCGVVVVAGCVEVYWSWAMPMSCAGVGG